MAATRSSGGGGRRGPRERGAAAAARRRRRRHPYAALPHRRGPARHHPYSGSVAGCAHLLLSQYVVAGYLRTTADGGGALGYLLKDRVGDIDAFLGAVERVARGVSSWIDVVSPDSLQRGRRDDPWEAHAPVSASAAQPLMTEGAHQRSERAGSWWSPGRGGSTPSGSSPGSACCPTPPSIAASGGSHPPVGLAVVDELEGGVDVEVLQRGDDRLEVEVVAGRRSRAHRPGSWRQRHSWGPRLRIALVIFLYTSWVSPSLRGQARR